MKAVVLSGGGGKGAYQIGVWKALRELNYDYKIVTGTSIGAINGLMMVQNKFYTSYYLWKNFNSKKLIGENFKNAQYIEYAKEFLRTGGVSTKNLEKFVNKLYNKRKFINSKINYGIVTYNLSKLNPCIKTKSELIKEDICKYIVASAACFPAFKMMEIDGEKYIDGGYYDNMPINLAIDMGATEVVAVDLEAIGLKRKLKNKNVDITYIRPNNEISNFLEFDKKRARIDLLYGYNDTMKKFGKLYGKKYTFHGNIISKRKYVEILSLHKMIFDDKVRITNFNLIRYLRKINNMETTQILFDEILENLLEKFDFADFKNYDAKKVSKQIYKKVTLLKDKIEIELLNNLINSNYKIYYIYQLFIEEKYDDISKAAKMMYDEFVFAMYLYFMKR